MQPSPARPPAATPKPPQINPAEQIAALTKKVAALAVDIAEIEAHEKAKKKARTFATLAELREAHGDDSPVYRRALADEAKKLVAAGKAEDFGSAIVALTRTGK